MTKYARWVVYAIVWRLRGVVAAGTMKFNFKPPRIRNAGTMRVGRAFHARAPVTRAQLHTGPAGRLVIGDDVRINEGVIIGAEASVTIGDHARIADFAMIHDSDYHSIEPGRAVRVRPVVIGRNVWLGRNVMVLPGVTIGDNAVIAAGAVVTRDVAANTLAGGVPARVIRALKVDDPDGYRRAPVSAFRPPNGAPGAR
jgi:acetyltransferase-like isoleucine patch superfamily enzyme